MTFTLSLPMLIVACVFGVSVISGGIISIKHKDLFYVFAWAIVGALLGTVGFGIGKGIEASTARRESKQIVYEKQCSHYDTMPEDWKLLYALLKKTETVPLRQAYVTDFLKSKSEPELSVEAYEVFFQTTDCSRYTTAYCLKWKLWLGHELAPYAIIDVQSALNLTVYSEVNN